MVGKQEDVGRVPSRTASKYRVNKDFVRQEPTPANFFCTVPLGAPHSEVYAVLERWDHEGARQLRITSVSDTHPNPPYPDGLWLEGWKDPKAEMLPFGEAHEGVIYPPLTAEASNA